jgi:Zn-dependent protease
MSFDISYIIIVLAVILVSMMLHEIMHGLVAYWLGDDTAKLSGRLSLNPLKHIDPFMTILLPLMLAIAGGPIFGGAKPVPFNPLRVKGGEWGAALVGIAGPLTNFVLAFFCFGLVVLVKPAAASLLGQILTVGVFVNLGFFVFNMLPIPPLDGSRVLYAVAPDAVRRAMEVIEQRGIMFIFLIVVVLSFVPGEPLGHFLMTIINAILAFFGMIFGVNVV